jgi:hypothetical protein
MLMNRHASGEHPDLPQVACSLCRWRLFPGHPDDDVEDAQERQIVRPSNAGLNVLEPRLDLRIPERAPDGFPEVPMVDAERLADPRPVEDGDQPGLRVATAMSLATVSGLYSPAPDLAALGESVMSATYRRQA